MAVEKLEVVVGTYEEYILGYSLVLTEKKTFSLVQSFANHSHKASIRCVATVGKLLASGGADEDIHLYDLDRRKESIILGYHNGTVNCLEFTTNGSHLLSGCEKGAIAVCRTGNWQVEKQWGAAHKESAVTSLSVHPSGKLALSVGTDGRLRTWNLVKGRQAYATHLAVDKFKQVSCVMWSPSGNLYAVLLLSHVDIYSMETAGVVYSIQSMKKLACICFLNDDLCVGDEEGMLFMHSIPQQLLLTELKAHKTRIKCMSHVDSWFVTASSDGIIKLWTLKTEDNLSEVCSVNTGCRITCLALVYGQNTTSVVKEGALKPLVSPLPRVDQKRMGVVVEVCDSDCSPKKRKSADKSKVKINKNKTFHESLKGTPKSKKVNLKKKKIDVSTSSVRDSSGQCWIVEDI